MRGQANNGSCSAGQSWEVAASIVVPGPLRDKLLFHKAALKNLERSMLIFSLPLSELVTQGWLQANTLP